jgi:hypothetical protein
LGESRLGKKNEYLRLAHPPKERSHVQEKSGIIWLFCAKLSDLLISKHQSILDITPLSGGLGVTTEQEKKRINTLDTDYAFHVNQERQTSTSQRALG